MQHPTRAAPEITAEISRECRRIAAQQKPDRHQPEQRDGLGEGEYVLHHGASAGLPRMFTALSTSTTTMPTSCCVVSPSRPLPIK